MSIERLVETLPAGDVPTHKLDATFARTTNSYKYLWFIAILEVVGRHRGRWDEPLEIPTAQLTSMMVALAWPTASFYRLRLGRRDQIQEALRGKSFGAPADLFRRPPAETARRLVELARGGEAFLADQKLDRYVPRRFLSPFFEQELRGLADSAKNKRIEELAEAHFGTERRPIYRFVGSRIQLDPRWLRYLAAHYPVVRSYADGKYVAFLTQRNPNVPGIASKLSIPTTRSLSSQRTLWRDLLKQWEPTYKTPFTCVYSSTPIEPDRFALDHFVPWSFVAHDQLWNLIPTTTAVNSQKSDRLPASPLTVPFSETIWKAYRLSRLLKKEAFDRDVGDALNNDFDLNRGDEFIGQHQGTIRSLLSTAELRGFSPGFSLDGATV